MSSFHKLTVKSIERLTLQSVSLSFEVPKHLEDTFKFKAGQYITLKTAISGKELRRDYSLCTSPKDGTLKIAIKEVQGGVFSSYANKILKEGDTLEVAPPQGRFVFEPNDTKTKNIGVFAAGSGITPVLSIIKCALKEETHSQVVLVYGNKTANDTMFFDDLLALQQEYKDRFSIQFVYSQQNENNAIFGRIDKSTVQYVLKNTCKDFKVDAFYLCGPEAMIHTVKNVLIENATAEKDIHFELFKAATLSPAENDSATTSGKTNITVVVDDEESTFEMSKKQTILEAALDKDLDAPYSCQGGICSSCIARVREGQAQMRQNTILTESEIAEGLVLTCQAHPTSSRIVIDFDDV